MCRVARQRALRPAEYLCAYTGADKRRRRSRDRLGSTARENPQKTVALV